MNASATLADPLCVEREAQNENSMPGSSLRDTLFHRLRASRTYRGILQF